MKARGGRLGRTLTLAGMALAAAAAQAQERPAGLLFHLSAAKGTTADLAAPGTAAPTFDSETAIIADGARGPAIQCGDLQRLAWRAPGNIYAQRGTLSFYWRSRYLSWRLPADPAAASGSNRACAGWRNILSSCAAGRSSSTPTAMRQPRRRCATASRLASWATFFR